jgi:hypothetical protein
MTATIPTIRLKYTCGTCGIAEREVDVVQRRKDEGVLHWMDVVVVSTIAVDHRRTSPYCQSTKMSQIEIPLSDTTGPVGGAR